MSKSHDGINRIVRFVFKHGSRTYSRRALSLGAWHFGVALVGKRKQAAILHFRSPLWSRSEAGLLRPADIILLV